jgi:hypothetical protein
VQYTASIIREMISWNLIQIHSRSTGERIGCEFSNHLICCLLKALVKLNGPFAAMFLFESTCNKNEVEAVSELTMKLVFGFGARKRTADYPRWQVQSLMWTHPILIHPHILGRLPERFTININTTLLPSSDTRRDRGCCSLDRKRPNRAMSSAR